MVQPDNVRLVTDARFRELFEDRLAVVLQLAGWTYADNGDGAGTWTPPAAGSGGIDQGMLDAALAGTPLIITAANGGTGTYAARPATARPVFFRGTTMPAANGSTAGGGGMVPGLDEWRYWSVA